MDCTVTMVQINSTKTDEISYYLNHLNYHRNHTISDVVGGFSHKKRSIIVTIINTEEINDVLGLIYEIDVNAFIYTIITLTISILIITREMPGFCCIKLKFFIIF